uniref:DUF2802 domain-containing protein n=1 Tax=Thaumasiovibrio occultus TaxID=1891184 RepID=UPI000B352E69|nr:DUF2802 domain-containing protein [Thaumasiovibrio occultus]
MNELLLQWLPAVLVLIVSGISFIMVRRERRARLAAEKRIAAIETVMKAARQQQESLAKQFKELQSGTLGMGNKLADMTRQIEMLEDRQGEIVMQNDPENKLYSRASRMAELGADIEELMKECDLPKAEAELMMRLRQLRR